MDVLQKCLDLTREIKETDDKIMDLKSSMVSPRSQRITGLPRGGRSLETDIDRYLVKVERYTEHRKRCKEKRNTLWKNIDKLLRDNGIQDDEIMMLYLRFMIGKQWSVCVTRLNEIYHVDTWNENKVFRVYRKVRQILYQN